MKLVSKVNHPNKRSHREGKKGSDVRSEAALDAQDTDALRLWACANL